MLRGTNAKLLLCAVKMTRKVRIQFSIFILMIVKKKKKKIPTSVSNFQNFTYILTVLSPIEQKSRRPLTQTYCSKAPHFIDANLNTQNRGF